MRQALDVARPTYMNFATSAVMLKLTPAFRGFCLRKYRNEDVIESTGFRTKSSRRDGATAESAFVTTVGKCVFARHTFRWVGGLA